MHRESDGIPLNSSPLTQDLRRALAAAQVEHVASQAALQTAVCAFIDDLRGQGMTLEQSIADVRSFVLSLRNDEPRRADLHADHDRALNRMIQWCNEHWGAVT